MAITAIAAAVLLGAKAHGILKRFAHHRRNISASEVLIFMVRGAMNESRYR